MHFKLQKGKNAKVTNRHAVMSKAFERGKLFSVNQFMKQDDTSSHAFQLLSGTSGLLPSLPRAIMFASLSVQKFLIHGRQPEVTISVLYIVSRNNTNGKQPLLTSVTSVSNTSTHAH